MGNNHVNSKSKSCIITFQTQVIKTYSDIVDSLVQGKDIDWFGDDNDQSLLKQNIEIDKNAILSALKSNAINYMLKETFEENKFKYILKSQPDKIKVGEFKCKIFVSIEDFINIINKSLSCEYTDYMLYLPMDFVKDEKIYYKLVLDKGEIKDVKEQADSVKDIITCQNAVRDTVLTLYKNKSYDEQNKIIKTYQEMLVINSDNVVTNLSEILKQIEADYNYYEGGNK